MIFWEFKADGGRCGLTNSHNAWTSSAIHGTIQQYSEKGFKSSSANYCLLESDKKIPPILQDGLPPKFRIVKNSSNGWKVSKLSLLSNHVKIVQILSKYLKMSLFMSPHQNLISQGSQLSRNQKGFNILIWRFLKYDQYLRFVSATSFCIV